MSTTGSGSPLATPAWAGFVAAMRWEPAEDMPRLAAADWLQEQGLPELDAWAAFIRLQVGSSRHGEPFRSHVYTDSCDCERCKPERDVCRLFDRWGAWWLHHTVVEIDTQVSPPMQTDYVRGFARTLMASIEPYNVADVPKLIPPLIERQPVRNLIVQLRKQSTSPYMRPLADYVLTLVIDPVTANSEKDIDHHAYVYATLRRPATGISSPGVSAHRRAYEPWHLPRMIRGVVGQVLRRRSSLFTEAEWRDRQPHPHLRRDTGMLRRSISP